MYRVILCQTDKPPNTVQFKGNLRGFSCFTIIRNDSVSFDKKNRVILPVGTVRVKGHYVNQQNSCQLSVSNHYPCTGALFFCYLCSTVACARLSLTETFDRIL